LSQPWKKDRGQGSVWRTKAGQWLAHQGGGVCPPRLPLFCASAWAHTHTHTHTCIHIHTCTHTRDLIECGGARTWQGRGVARGARTSTWRGAGGTGSTGLSKGVGEAGAGRGKGVGEAGPTQRLRDPSACCGDGRAGVSARQAALGSAFHEPRCRQGVVVLSKVVKGEIRQVMATNRRGVHVTRRT